ncbi:MAG: DUF4231 domain-containing protein [Chloroflexota bacterium]
MAEKDKKETEVPDVADGKIEDLDKYVYNMYADQIEYYHRAGAANKKYYKNYRSLTIILGALVTLIASLASSTFVESVGLGWFLGIATPVLAAALTIINGLGQNFQWGATWRDMMIAAQRLEKERDRFLATPPGKRNYRRELEIINELVLQETRAFFQRVLDSEVTPTNQTVVTEENTP